MTEQAMDFARSALKEQGERIERLEEALREIVLSIEGGGNIVTFNEADIERYRAILSKSHGGGDGEVDRG